MKTIVVGDIHGNALWKSISMAQEFDKFIFIGDYFDSFDIDGETQIQNFRDIIKFKEDNPYRVILLIGNHDFHYIEDGEHYSGFQRGTQFMIKDLLKSAKDLMQMCHVQDEFMFTHAGVTKTWLTDVGFYDESKETTEHYTIEGFINELWEYQPRKFGFGNHKQNMKMSEYRYANEYGNNIFSSPLWVRPESLNADALEGYTHIVGHTAVQHINPNEKMILIDALHEPFKEYLIIEVENDTTKLIVKNV